MMVTTFTELVNKIHAILPDATFAEDNEGQLIIYTGLIETDHDKLHPFTIDEGQQ